jgi:transglutaminase-like putative cysteine protease
MRERDAVIHLNKFLQTRLTYDRVSAASVQRVFTSPTPIKGACGTYAHAFQYLMERVGIPCVTISGDNHAWNMVYIGGKWLHCDPTNSRITNDGLLRETIRFKPTDPQRLEFAKEILVPSSTK